MTKIGSPNLRIGLLSVFYAGYNGSERLRQDREPHARTVAAALAKYGDVVSPGMVDSEQAGREASDLFLRESVDVVVFAPTMAAPPSFAWEAVRHLDVPVVAIGAQESASVPNNLEWKQSTNRSQQVGLVMFTNVLLREGRPVFIVTGHLSSMDFAQRLRETMTAIATAKLVGRARLGLIGGTIPGYLDVEATPEDLAILGVAPVFIDPADVARASDAVDPTRIENTSRDLRQRWDASAVPEDMLTRSVRLSLAIEELCAQHGLAGGAINCHAPDIRWNERIGVMGCLAVSRLCEEGMPFACTGDLPTAVALIIGKAVGGSALYAEILAVDIPGDWVLVANGGEGDPQAAVDGQVVLTPRLLHAGAQGNATATEFRFPTGPATLIGMSPRRSTDPRWVLLVAEGTTLPIGHPELQGTNAAFRFGTGPVIDAYERWCLAGATHHAVLVPGAQAKVLESVARLLKLDFVVV